MDLLRIFRPSDPSLNLDRRLETILGRMDSMEKAFQAMKLDWEIVTAHLDQQSNKVHRELGHITRQKREVLALQEGCPDDPPQKRSRFQGGRNR